MDAQEIYGEIKESFIRSFEKSEQIKRLLNRIDTEKATFTDLWTFSRQVGHLSSRAAIEQAENLLVVTDPYDQIMDYLRTCCYEPVADYAVQTQQIRNAARGIGLKAQKADFDASRASGIAHNVANAEDVEKIKKMLGPSLEAFTDKTIPDTIRKNGGFLRDAGVSTKVIRIADPKCCDWCQSIAGTYDYDDVKRRGANVWLMHDNCGCRVEMDFGHKRIRAGNTRASYEDQERRQTVARQKRDAELPDGVTDVTASFLRESTPGKGTITKGKGFHDQNGEYENAEWLKRKFGGKIECLGEKDGQLNPDYRWNITKADGAFWDLKISGSSKERTLENIIRHGMHQIEKDAGGIIIDMTASALDYNQGLTIVGRVSQKRAKNDCFVIYKKDNDFTVLRIKK